MKKQIENMKLPLVNPNEELETTSRVIFEKLLIGSDLELREDPKDKGVDFSLEIKTSGRHINFRGLVQLKATAAIEANSDGSFSLQVQTSNINYLLNSGLPCYYILYHNQNNELYYVHLNDFILTLKDKSLDWESQDSHVLRFSNVLDDSAIRGIYNTIYDSGIARLEINEKLILNMASVMPGDKVLIDKNLNVLSDAEIREMIEVAGIDLINEGRWKDIITLHEKASQKVNATPAYNLILGIANYYQGQMVEALKFFKHASQGRAALKSEQQQLLCYFDIAVKYSIGILSKAEYEGKMNSLETGNIVGLYVKLEQAKRSYLSADADQFEDNFRIFKSDINDIISDPSADSNIQLLARCEVVLIEGNRNLIRFQQGISRLNAIELQIGQPSPELRQQAIQSFLITSQEWYRTKDQLKTDALEKKNHLAYCNTLLNEVRVQYEMTVSSKMFTMVIPIPGGESMPDFSEDIQEMKTKLNTAMKFYEAIGYTDNIVVTLSLKYELLHFFGDFEEADKTINQAESIASGYDNPEHVRQITKLKNGGTTHEKLKAWMERIFATAETEKKRFDEMRKEMETMDQREAALNLYIAGVSIELFPIGIFQIPETALETAYDILHINDTNARKQFTHMLCAGIRAIANILNDPIEQEGPANGYLDDKGIESMNNIYRIRKAFHEHKFYRKT